MDTDLQEKRTPRDWRGWPCTWWSLRLLFWTICSHLRETVRCARTIIIAVLSLLGVQHRFSPFWFWSLYESLEISPVISILVLFYFIAGKYKPRFWSLPFVSLYSILFTQRPNQPKMQSEHFIHFSYAKHSSCLSKAVLRANSHHLSWTFRTDILEILSLWPCSHS